MSGLWPSARAIGRRGSCLTTPSAFLRNATTAAKPRIQKTVSSAGEDAGRAAKTALNTKTRAPTGSKIPKKKAEFSAPTFSAGKPTSTTSSKTTRPGTVKKNSPAAKNVEVREETKTEAAQTTATEAPAAPTVLPQAPPVGAWKPTAKPREAAPAVKKPVDINSREYKSAARKWTALIVALPILFVTSYYLYDRLALGNGPGLMDPAPTPPPPKDKTLDT
ncbi:hypothetical protein B0T18DRAFT_427816 [Schizothecium vesticola]|uniref:Uncharacterized protein n=1 Tax=Schizothecium vesticola TaxID=314040 RepID=A0AA40K8B9_9PEZI|nr:hypothetical protein B0T18DRAFT_427816 [Schizothecium vesticola]